MDENFNRPKLAGANNTAKIIDAESTGLEDDDELIQLSILTFKFTDDLRISSVESMKTFYNEPKNKPITPLITQLTGITPAMVKGHHLTCEDINNNLSFSEATIAHNAFFDRNLIERSIPGVTKTVWGCSASDIDWRARFFTAKSLDYLAYKYGFYYDAHDSAPDCLALYRILSEENNFEELMTAIYTPEYEAFVSGMPYHLNSILKNLNFKWDPDRKGWQRNNIKNLDEIPDDVKNGIYGNNCSLTLKDNLDRYRKK